MKSTNSFNGCWSNNFPILWYKSPFTPYFSRKSFVLLQKKTIWFSSWISPHSHNLSSLGVRDHLPVLASPWLNIQLEIFKYSNIRSTFNEKVHRIRKTSRNRLSFFERNYDAKEVIHKRISWNPENISKSGPKVRPKIVKKLNRQWKGASNPRNLAEPFFAFSKEITMLKKWFISAFPEIQKTYLKICSPKLGQKTYLKNWILQQKTGASNPRNLTEPSFPFSKVITMLEDSDS